MFFVEQHFVPAVAVLKGLYKYNTVELRLRVCLFRRGSPHIRRSPHWDVWKKSRHAGPLQKGTDRFCQGFVEAHTHLSWAHITFHSPFCIHVCFRYSWARLRETCESALQVLRVSLFSSSCLFLLCLNCCYCASLPRCVQTVPEAPPPHSHEINIIFKLSESEWIPVSPP